MKVHELGHLVLYVRNLERSRRFYRDVLGWTEVTTVGRTGAVFSSGRTHHELLLLEVGADAAPMPAGRRLGLYHFGLKIGTTDEELREALATLEREGVPLLGTGDHGVTHSAYIADPDGNEIELYIDVQPEIWREDPEAIPTSARCGCNGQGQPGCSTSSTPMLDDRNVTPSSREFSGEWPGWPREMNLLGWRTLLGDAVGASRSRPMRHRPGPRISLACRARTSTAATSRSSATRTSSTPHG